MNYRIGRKDPEYEQAMREAKILFEAAIAKSAVKGRGRPANAPVPAAAAVVEPDGDVADEVEAVIEVPVAPVTVAAAPAKPATKPAAKAAKPAAKPAPKSAAKTATKARGTTSPATTTPARPATRRRPMATADQG